MIYSPFYLTSFLLLITLFFFNFEVAAGYIDNIREAIAEFKKYTCIKWKPRGKEKYWVRFIKGKG